MSDATIIENEEPKKPSIVVRLVLPVILILASAGAGFGFAKGYVAPMFDQQAAMIKAEAKDAEAKMAMKGKDANAEQVDSSGEETMTSIVPLSPVVTNLAEPSDVWVRAEFSLVFDDMPEAGMPEQIQADFVAHLRSLNLKNLEGSSGFQHLIADLNELAMMRSEKKVSRVLVRAFLVE